MSLIPGPCGSIDVSFHKASAVRAPVALLVPPHPQKEGDMSCPALKNIFMLFVDMGFSVISFNYRGVGYSSGSFTEGECEISDAAACLDWVRQKVDSDSFCWILGYSFGAYIALQVLMRRPEIGRFIVMDMDTTKDFSFLAPCPISGLFLQGTDMHERCGDATRSLIQSLSFQNASNSFESYNVPSPNAFSDSFFKSAHQTIQNYILSPDQDRSEGALSAA